MVEFIILRTKMDHLVVELYHQSDCRPFDITQYIKDGTISEEDACVLIVEEGFQLTWNGLISLPLEYIEEELTLQEVVNIVDNSPGLIEVPAGRLELLVSYLRLKSIPFTFIYDDELPLEKRRTMRCHPPKLSREDLVDMSDQIKRLLLIDAVRYYHPTHIKMILDSGYVPNDIMQFDLPSPESVYTLLQFPQLYYDRLSLFEMLVIKDEDLIYCIRDEFKEDWNKIDLFKVHLDWDDENISRIDNRITIEWMCENGIKVPSCDQIMENYSKESSYLPFLMINVISQYYPIMSDGNIRRLIDITINGICYYKTLAYNILINLVRYGKVDLTQFKGISTQVDYLI